MPRLSIEETIKAYTNENGFSWGINTVMSSLAPNTTYVISAGEQFTVDVWESDLPKPTSEEITKEYIRQQTIAECIEYYKTKNVLKRFIKKLYK